MPYQNSATIPRPPNGCTGPRALILFGRLRSWTSGSVSRRAGFFAAGDCLVRFPHCFQPRRLRELDLQEAEMILSRPSTRSDANRTPGARVDAGLISSAAGRLESFSASSTRPDSDKLCAIVWWRCAAPRRSRSARPAPSVGHAIYSSVYFKSAFPGTQVEIPHQEASQWIQAR